MRRSPLLVCVLSIAAVPATALAGPPALPDGEGAPADPGPAGDDAAGAAEAGADAGAGGSFGFDLGGDGPGADAELDADADAKGGGKGKRRGKGKRAKTGAATGGADGEGDLSPSGGAQPGMAEGRREPMMPTLRGSIGHFYTALPDVGDQWTFRFQANTDFFSKRGMFVDSSTLGRDRHARVRGGLNLGFSFTRWAEAYFSLAAASNRNERDDPARQDPSTVFAFGDMDFGLKGAWRFKEGGIGVGGVVGMGLVSGTGRLLTERVNFNIDALFAVDLRYLTRAKVPLRFATNLGFLLDNSNKLIEFGAISDPASREVLRFGLGVNQPRMRTRYAVDAPIRFGKGQRFGIDPFLEYSWDFSLIEDPDFRELTELGGASPLPRSQSWLTIGLRANLYDGLTASAGVDVGTVSPNYEYGPPVPPYQVVLALGWSFDPRGRERKIVEAAPEPAPAGDGRLFVRVLDPNGAPVAGVKVRVVEDPASPMTTDDGGAVVTGRIAAGPVTLDLELPDGSRLQRSAEIMAGEDRPIDIALEAAPVPPEPPEGLFDLTITDGAGAPIAGRVHLSGQGIDESFSTDPVRVGRLRVALPPGEYQAEVTADGHQPKRTSVTIEADGTAKLALALESDLPAETPNVRGTDKSITLRKPIRYKGDELDPASFELLDELAAFLRARPEYQQVEIRVHTDDRGNPTARSQARADAVVSYLTSKGVAADRLIATGYGAKAPVAVNITEAGRRKNNRTQLVVKRYEKG